MYGKWKSRHSGYDGGVSLGSARRRTLVISAMISLCFGRPSGVFPCVRHLDWGHNLWPLAFQAPATRTRVVSTILEPRTHTRRGSRNRDRANPGSINGDVTGSYESIGLELERRCRVDAGLIDEYSQHHVDSRRTEGHDRELTGQARVVTCFSFF